MAIRPGQQVLVRLPADNLRVVQLVPGQTVNLGRSGSVPADALIGQPFGYTYEVDSTTNTVHAVDMPDFKVEDDVLGSEQTMDGDKISYEGEQELSMEDIEALKREGLTGDELIERIQAANAAFNHKTEYSKAKYLKRKKSKYIQQFTPEPIGAAEVLDIFLAKDPPRVLNMSVETLALALNYANVHEGGHYLVVDETPGVLAAAVLERGGHVTIAHESEHPNTDCFRFLDFVDPKKWDSIPLLDLLSPDDMEPPTPEKSEEELKEMKPSARGQYYRRRARDIAVRDMVAFATTRGYDGLLVASTLVITDLVPRLLDFIAGSRPVVVYSQFPEPLVDASLAFRGNEHRLLALEIIETRIRKFQTLPGRIHPLMTSRGHGGFLLRGLRVYFDSSATAVGRSGGSRKRARIDTGETGSDREVSAIPESEMEP